LDDNEHGRGIIPAHGVESKSFYFFLDKKQERLCFKDPFVAFPLIQHVIMLQGEDTTSNTQ
jgi:hypothetical protein